MHMYLHSYISDCLLSLHSSRSLASVRVSKTKYVVWTQDMNHVAILGKHSKSFTLYVLYSAYDTRTF